MDLRLKRKDFLESGIFGELESIDGNMTLQTLEHPYEVDGTFQPKVPPGTYTCVRGLHELEHMTAPFTTYEITGVEGHTNILFHVGNTKDDSRGCVLVGLFRNANFSIMHSKAAFDKFLEVQNGAQSFTLVVI